MKYILILFSLVLFVSCQSAKTSYRINTLSESKSSDTFDIEKFNRLSTGGEYWDTLKDGTIIRRMSSDIDFVEFAPPPIPNIMEIYKSFHLNGKLKVEGLRYPNKFGKGVWREYDEQGNLIKEEDYDEGYEYSFEDLLKFIYSRNIDLFDKYTSIRRYDGIWKVIYVQGEGYPKHIYDVTIDGKTGKIISDHKNEFSIE